MKIWSIFSRTGRPIANETQIKFGYPDTLIAEYEHWCVLLRPAQATLGAMVLVCTDDARQFADISPGAFAELGTAVHHIETASKALRPWQKINLGHQQVNVETLRADPRSRPPPAS